MDEKEYIKNIVINGTPAEKRTLYSFTSKDSNEKVLKKFELFSRGNFIRFFKSEDAPFHRDMAMDFIKSYRGGNLRELAFRSASKTSIFKMFLCFVLENDEDHSKKYIKILSRDLKNPKQIVTDVYNMCLELIPIYGNPFEKEGDKKREETMGSFTMKSGVKLTAGTVGQAQRGHVQDAFRPDWIIFDDVEDRESVSSAVITQGIIEGCDEAITGLDPVTGSWLLLGNYISENGVVQWFLDKSNAETRITPIATDVVMNGKTLVSCNPTWSIFNKEKIQLLMKDSIDVWGEYFCEPSKADNKFFDIDRINEDLKHCPAPLWVKDGVKQWNIYENHMRYTLGADTSEGIGKDSNAFTMWNTRTGEQVAAYHSNEIKPELFAYKFAEKAKEFGSCIVAPEINNYSGGIVITTLRQIYPEDKIFRHTDNRNANDRESGKLGWYTTSLSKTNAFMEFRKDYNDGLIKVKDPDLLKEMKMYTEQDLSTTGDSNKVTRHFDLLVSCFVKDTMVLTKKGQMPIQYIKPGDFVLTREGYKKVLKTSSQPKPVINNIGLRGTSNHPVILANGEIKPLLQVSEHSDTLVVWNQFKKAIENMSFTMAQSILDTQMPQKEITESTTTVEQSGKCRLRHYTGKYGKTLMEKYLLVLLFIIKMVTPLITLLKTLSFFQNKTTNENIWQIQTEKSLQEIRLTKKKIEKKHVWLWSLETINQSLKEKVIALFVVTVSYIITMLQNTVLLVVKMKVSTERKDYQKKQRLVELAETILKLLNRGKKAVQSSVLKEEIEQVYNIEVEDCPEYFANNILVHNCVIAWSAKSYQIQEQGRVIIGGGNALLKTKNPYGI